MNKTITRETQRLRQAGLSLIEMIVSIAISLIVLSGVVNVMVVSKSNFISQREMAGLQENARFALKYMTDEIRQAGFTGCIQPQIVTNIVKGSPTSWYLGFPGLQGYEYDAGIATFPTEFKNEVRANTDAIVVRRGEATGLRRTSETTTTITTSANHTYKPGQPMLIVQPDCENIGMFQISSVTANTMLHATTTASPGNGIGFLKSTASCTYNAAGTVSGTAPTSGPIYLAESTLLALHSEAYYVGNSESDATVPALFRERMMVNTTTNAAYTAEEELVQGVENMQVLYGIDTITSSTGAAPSDGLADAYVKASAITGTGAMLWSNVVSVRVTLRMRSVNPVYANSETYSVFEGVTGTDGSDRYMRQTISSTIMIRNFRI